MPYTFVNSTLQFQISCHAVGGAPSSHAEGGAQTPPNIPGHAAWEREPRCQERPRQTEKPMKALKHARENYDAICWWRKAATAAIRNHGTAAKNVTTMPPAQRRLAAVGSLHSALAAVAAATSNPHNDATRMKALKGGFVGGKKRCHGMIGC